MSALVYWTGAIVWALFAGSLIYVLGWIAYCLAGYIYGQFRLARIGAYRREPGFWRLVREGIREWWTNFPGAGGWYREFEEGKVYTFGFFPIEKHDADSTP